VAEAGGVKAGLLINATRVAIVGQAVAPPLFDTMVVLGQQLWSGACAMRWPVSEILAQDPFKKIAHFSCMSKLFFRIRHGRYCFPKSSECAGFAAEAEAATFSVASSGALPGAAEFILQAW